jgi:hypothetical protein
MLIMDNRNKETHVNKFNKSVNSFVVNKFYFRQSEISYT